MRTASSPTTASNIRLVLVGVIGLVSITSGSTVVRASSTGDGTVETVDNQLCAFPLDITVSNAGEMHRIGKTNVRVTGHADVTLRNLTTHATALLKASGPFAFDRTTHTATFSGVQLWFGGQFVPYLTTNGKGSFDANFVLTSASSNATVIDPCALVGPVPSVQPVTGPAPWGLPTDALSQIKFAGLIPLIGSLIRHDHEHLDVIVNGQAVTVPAGVGQAEPQDFGPCPAGITNGDCATGHFVDALVAISPLHTHSSSGIIHVEADRSAVFTLGEFFNEWGVRLSQTCIGGYCADGSNEMRVYVNGTQVTGDPSAVVFSEHQEIAVIYGGPGAFNSVPSTYNGGWPDDPGGGCGGTGEPSCNP